MSGLSAGIAPATWKIAGALALVYVVWGSTYLAIRFAVETLPPFLMAGTRFLVGGAGLWLLARWSGADRPTPAQWLQAAVIGVLLLAGGNGLVCWAQQSVPSGLAALIIASIPLWMVGLDVLLYGAARPGMRVLVGLAVGLAGVATLFWPSTAQRLAIDPWGAVGLLAACFFWSLGSLRSRRADLPESPFVVTAMEMLAGGGVLMLMGTCLGEWPRVQWEHISWKSLVALGYLIVFGAMITLSAYAWLLRVCDAATVATYAYVNPVIAVLLGVWLASERVTPSMACGAGMILTAVVMVNWRPRRPRESRISGKASRSIPAESEAVLQGE